MFPMYYTPSRGITGADALRNYSALQISTDKGSTWKTCNVPGSDGLVQPDVIDLSSEHLLTFFRSRFADWVYKSTSEDGCCWTIPTPTQIPNNNSSTQAVDNGKSTFAIVRKPPGRLPTQQNRASFQLPAGAYAATLAE